MAVGAVVWPLWQHHPHTVLMKQTLTMIVAYNKQYYWTASTPLHPWLHINWRTRAIQTTQRACLCVCRIVCVSVICNPYRQTATSLSSDSAWLRDSPLRHCYPIYVSLQLDIWRQSALCVFVCLGVCVFVCVSVTMLTEEFSARAHRVEKWDAGNRMTERELSVFSGSTMSQAGYFGRVWRDRWKVVKWLW